MATEIERKFLVKDHFRSFVVKETRIIQGYLCSVPERTIRIRVTGIKGFITVKGKGNASGATRYEWENEIPVDEAHELLKLCEPGMIDKTRYLVPESSGLFFEVDVFHGDNEGLTIAEIELPAEKYSFEKPDWLGEEVTGQERFYNAMLTKYPFKKWKDH